jgi:hypothetical protein
MGKEKIKEENKGKLSRKGRNGIAKKKRKS